MKSGFYSSFGKRLFDVVASSIALLLLFPLIAIIVVLLWVTQGRPVFFRQVRPGRNQRPFKMIKFRTMLDTTDRHGTPLADAERITGTGAFLRRTSLDELPELWNVVIGQMSLVGPRPLLMEYLPHYTAEQNRRHDVLPGVTGLAQVTGRQTLRFSQRLEKDVWYVDNLSLVLDIKILWQTVQRVLTNRDVIVGQEVEEVDDIGLSRDIVKPVKKEGS